AESGGGGRRPLSSAHISTQAPICHTCGGSAGAGAGAADARRASAESAGIDGNMGNPSMGTWAMHGTPEHIGHSGTPDSGKLWIPQGLQIHPASAHPHPTHSTSDNPCYVKFDVGRGLEWVDTASSCGSEADAGNGS